MSRYTLASIGVLLLMAGSALEGEWCGITAFAVALLMLFELDLHAEQDDDDNDDNPTENFQ